MKIIKNSYFLKVSGKTESTIEFSIDIEDGWCDGSEGRQPSYDMMQVIM